jgi:chromosome segregation ATPase
MFGLSAAWSALSIAKVIPFRFLMMILAALTITIAIEGGYRYVRDLNASNASLSTKLGEEMVARAEAEAVTEQIRQQHDQSVDRLNELEEARSKADMEASDLRAKLQSVPTKQDTSHDPKKTASDFASRSRELNRLLEHATKVPNRGAVPRTP